MATLVRKGLYKGKAMGFYEKKVFRNFLESAGAMFFCNHYGNNVQLEYFNLRNTRIVVGSPSDYTKQKDKNTIFVELHGQKENILPVQRMLLTEARKY